MQTIPLFRSLGPFVESGFGSICPFYSPLGEGGALLISFETEHRRQKMSCARNLSKLEGSSSKNEVKRGIAEKKILRWWERKASEKRKRLLFWFIFCSYNKKRFVMPVSFTLHGQCLQGNMVYIFVFLSRFGTTSHLSTQVISLDFIHYSSSFRCNLPQRVE